MVMVMVTPRVWASASAAYASLRSAFASLPYSVCVSIEVSSSRGQSRRAPPQIPPMPCHVIVRGMQTEPRPGAALAEGPPTPAELKKLHAYWRAANYLSVGQIYLLANALLPDALQDQRNKPL